MAANNIASHTAGSQVDFPYIDNIIANTQDPGVRDLLTSFKQHHRQWKASICRRKLINNLQQHRPAGGWKITKAACFALGTFASRPEKSLYQLTIFLDIVSTSLQPDCARPIRVVLQDPRFSALDLQVLAALDLYAIKSDHEAQELISHRLFSFAPWIPLEHELIARLPGTQPSLHIGKRADAIEQKLKCIAEGVICPMERDLIKLRGLENEDPARQLELLEGFRETHDEFPCCGCEVDEVACDAGTSGGRSPVAGLVVHAAK